MNIRVNRKLIVLIVVVILSSLAQMDAYATVQVKDSIYIKDKSYSLYSLLFDGCPNLPSNTGKYFDFSGSHMWKGYRARWIIEDNKLYLTYFKAKKNSKLINLQELFKTIEEKVFASWFSGRLIVFSDTPYQRDANARRLNLYVDNGLVSNDQLKIFEGKHRSLFKDYDFIDGSFSFAVPSIFKLGSEDEILNADFKKRSLIDFDSFNHYYLYDNPKSKPRFYLSVAKKNNQNNELTPERYLEISQNTQEGGRSMIIDQNGVKCVLAEYGKYYAWQIEYNYFYDQKIIQLRMVSGSNMYDVSLPNMIRHIATTLKLRD